MEQGVVVEAELAADAPALFEDFRGVGILLGRPVPGLFEQRHIDHRGGVALGAGVSVPVPGAAEVAALLDDADILDARLDQPRAGDQAGESSADEGEGDVVGFGLTLDEGRVGVLEIVGEGPFDPEVLVVAVGADSLVALGDIAGEQGLLVESRVSRPT